MNKILEPITLKNGLTILFEDQSNRYYGDFHRVYLKVLITLPEQFELPDGLDRESAVLERTLEKMGVPTVALAAEQKALIDAFLATARNYLEKEDFPQRLAQKLLLEKSRPVRPVFLRNM